MFQYLHVGGSFRSIFTLTLLAVAHLATAATNIVTTTADDNSPGTLRGIISASVSGDTIIFAPYLSGTTIFITNKVSGGSPALRLTKNLTIDASALPAGIQLNGNAGSCVLFVDLATTNILTGLTITNGLSSESDNGLSYPNIGDGGGVLNYGTLTLNRCRVVGNTANISTDGFTHAHGNGGGGVANESSATLTVNQCTFAGNLVNPLYTNGSSGTGAGICNHNGKLTVNDSTFSGNGTAKCQAGGAIYSSTTNTVLNQCTLSGNNAYNGGAMGGAGTIIQSTLSLNNAERSGGALNGTFTVSNSIIAGNTVPFWSPSLSTSNFAGTLANSANNIIDVLPILSPLGNYGGFTQTMPPLPGSPAIDACTNGTSFTIDQRGYPRPVDGNGDTVAVADIGAVEGIAFPYGVGPFTEPKKLGNTFQFSFPGNTGQSYTVFGGTNLASPVETWSNLGPAIESPSGSGQYQFTDPQATNNPSRFYRVRSP